MKLRDKTFMIFRYGNMSKFNIRISLYLDKVIILYNHIKIPLYMNIKIRDKKRREERRGTYKKSL